MVGGMRMDLVKSRYRNYDELYDYCYRVAGTVGPPTLYGCYLAGCWLLGWLPASRLLPV